MCEIEKKHEESSVKLLFFLTIFFIIIILFFFFGGYGFGCGIGRSRQEVQSLLLWRASILFKKINKTEQIKAVPGRY